MPQSQEANASISFDGKQQNVRQTIRVGLLNTTAVGRQSNATHSRNLNRAAHTTNRPTRKRAVARLKTTDCFAHNTTKKRVTSLGGFAPQGYRK